MGQKKPTCGSQIWELLLDCSEKNWNLDAKHVQAHRTEQEKEAMTAEGTYVVDGNEKADELPKDGADVGGSALAPAKFLTINQCRKDMSASTAYAAHFHVQVEEWKDRDDTVPNEEQTWQSLREKTRRRKIQVHKMREQKHCGEYAGHLTWLQVDRQRIEQTVLKYGNRHQVGHDLKRIVGSN